METFIGEFKGMNKSEIVNTYDNMISTLIEIIVGSKMKLIGLRQTKRQKIIQS